MRSGTIKSRRIIRMMSSARGNLPAADDRLFQTVGLPFEIKTVMVMGTNNT